jgi:hypothetical protein
LKYVESVDPTLLLQQGDLLYNVSLRQGCLNPSR